VLTLGYFLPLPLSCVQETDRCEPNPCPQVCLDYGDRVACECSHGFTGTTTIWPIHIYDADATQLNSRVGLGCVASTS